MLRLRIFKRGVSGLTTPQPSTKTITNTYNLSMENVPITKISRLPNGFTIATDTNHNFQTVTVGVYINSGSRFEDVHTNGAGNFLQHMMLKGTKGKGFVELETQIEAMGSSLKAYSTRETRGFHSTAIAADVPKAVSTLGEILQDSLISKEALDQERGVLISHLNDIEENKEALVMEHPHGIAFQGTSLGLNSYGPKDHIKTIQREDLVNFAKRYFTSERMVLAASGNVDHEELVKLAEKSFGSLKPGQKDQHPRAHFTGSDLRARYDNLKTASVALAVEGCSYNSPDYYPLKIAEFIIGQFSRHTALHKFGSSRLTQRVIDQPFKSFGYLCNNFKAFNICYKDTGLFGIYTESDNITHLDDLIHHINREFHRLALNLTDIEVFRAKNQLKFSLFNKTFNSIEKCKAIGEDVLKFGEVPSLREIEREIEKVTTQDVMKVCGEYLYDREVAVVGYGPVDGLQDLNRIRAAMAPTYY